MDSGGKGRSVEKAKRRTRRTDASSDGGTGEIERRPRIHEPGRGGLKTITEAFRSAKSVVKRRTRIVRVFHAAAAIPSRSRRRLNRRTNPETYFFWFYDADDNFTTLTNGSERPPCTTRRSRVTRAGPSCYYRAVYATQSANNTRQCVRVRERVGRCAGTTGDAVSALLYTTTVGRYLGTTAALVIRFTT